MTTQPTMIDKIMEEICENWKSDLWEDRKMIRKTLEQNLKQTTQVSELISKLQIKYWYAKWWYVYGTCDDCWERLKNVEKRAWRCESCANDKILQSLAPAPAQPQVQVSKLLRDYELRMEAEQNILRGIDEHKLPNQSALCKWRISVISQAIKDLSNLAPTKTQVIKLSKLDENLQYCWQWTETTKEWYTAWWTKNWEELVKKINEIIETQNKIIDYINTL